MSESDLFVVCKNCSSEVSPYVTECPYCGQRVRKRAPKIERGASAEGDARSRRPRTPTLSRMRRGEIPGIASETRPYATCALIVIPLVIMLIHQAGALSYDQLGAVLGPIGNGWWRVLTTPFVVDNGGTALITLIAVAVFGTLIERRFGSPAVIAIFLLAGAAGAALSVAVLAYPAIGANGAALGLLVAWLVDDRLAHRRGDDRGNDLLGVWVFAAVLFLLPVADLGSSFFAGVGGAATGAAVGALISPFRT